MAQQWAVLLGTIQYWRALMKYTGTSINHCLSDYKMAVLKWLPGPAKTPSSYVPLVSHHFQSAFRVWEIIYARSLNSSKIKPLCVWVICQHPNHWATPENPGFFVMLAIYSTGYSNSISYSCTARISQVIRTDLAVQLWSTICEKQIFSCAAKWCKSQHISSLKSKGQKFSVRPH